MAVGVKIGLDVGDVRVGVAISRSGSLAQPHAVYLRAGKKAEQEILTLVKELSVDFVICGLPLSEDESENAQCQRVRSFCERIQKRSAAKVIYVDEYCSSVEAGELLSLTGRSGKKSEARLDAAAATLILQAYLDNPGIALS